MNKAIKKKWLWLALVCVALLLFAAGFFVRQRFLGSAPIQPGFDPSTPAPLATWPWPQAAESTLRRGVKHWMARQDDGTIVDLFEFDFIANPALRFEIFDQDEDDKKPFDNVVHYWPRGVGQATRQLNQQFARDKNGVVVAAWNGAFFGYHEGRPDKNGTAFHVSPVVLNGQVRFNIANHRWAFGVKYLQSKPTFKVFHLPSRETLATEFDYAAGSVQCLVKDGKPLALQPFPAVGTPPLPQPVPSTPQEAGHIPVFDHMKTCRASLGWSKDNRYLYLLFVKEPDSETGSAVAQKRGLPLAGGWTTVDVQRFWLAKKVWTAINSDAGDVAQLAFLRPQGDYVLVPPRWTGLDYMRRNFSPEFKNAPQGGAIMYFYVRDSIDSQRP